MKLSIHPTSQAAWRCLRAMSTLTVGSFIFLSLLDGLFFTPVAAIGSNPNKVLLKDVKTLTLRQGRQTTYRRTYAVPQLKCVGGDAKGSGFRPEVVQCTNAGSDGVDIQWECKADLPKDMRFGEIEVFCEGYGYPEDPYILKGSCGLEYTLQYTGYRESNQWTGADEYFNQWRNTTKRASFFDTFNALSLVLVIGVIVLFCAYHGDETHSSRHRNEPPPPYYPTDPRSGGGGGGGPGFGGGPAGGSGHGGVPPPGYKATDTSSSSSQGSGRAGFWTGAGLGAAAAYLATSAANRERQYNSQDRYGSSSSSSSGSGYRGGSSFRSSSSSSFASSSSGTRTATGFGGTRRR